MFRIINLGESLILLLNFALPFLFTIDENVNAHEERGFSS